MMRHQFIWLSSWNYFLWTFLANSAALWETVGKFTKKFSIIFTTGLFWYWILDLFWKLNNLMLLHFFAQTDKFTQPRVKRQSSQGDNALHSLLHNGYSTDQEKSDHLSLPGARVRKRFSVGKDAESDKL